MKTIAIAGSNGKSTTVSIICSILRNAGKRVYLASDVVDFKDFEGLYDNYDYMLIEMHAPALEKLQIGLEYGYGFDISVLLNVLEYAPESISLDYSGNGANNSILRSEYYAKTLGKVYAGTKEICVFNSNDREVDYLVQNAEVVDGARAVGFSGRSPSRSQIGVVEGEIVDRAFYNDDSDPLRYLNATPVVNVGKLANLHTPVGTDNAWLIQNICAAIAVCRALNIYPESIASSLSQFRLQNSQFELVYKRDLKLEPEYYFGEINYINDLYTQDLNGTKANIMSLPLNSVIWIAGGDTRLFDYGAFIEEVGPHLLGVVLIGTENSPIYQALRHIMPNIPAYIIEPSLDTSSIVNAITKAHSMASENNNIIFSPSADVNALGAFDDINQVIYEQYNTIRDKYNEIATVNEFTVK